jgi:hypothetical protein
MTSLELSLTEWIIKNEASLRKMGHELADTIRLGLYWRLVEAHAAEGVDISPAVEHLKQTLKGEL